ncbi:hypothetical protein Hamer_G000393 [Homarus americanus]|uniref:Uncharacterized protein n=1 Tax=Homarus americanus TaxID=6706 RepID=A0A8J5TLR2_HOMAM|nr:hypothetical protein Hamer_G000393 [Homarus americanus]
MKRNTLRWYGHVLRMREDRLTKKVYDRKRERGMLGEVDQLPPGRKVFEILLMREREGKEDCLREQVRCARIKWPGDISAMATPCWGAPGREQGIGHVD